MLQIIGGALRVTIVEMSCYNSLSAMSSADNFFKRIRPRSGQTKRRA